jgi:hypothetical protein
MEYGRNKHQDSINPIPMATHRRVLTAVTENRNHLPVLFVFTGFLPVSSIVLHCLGLISLPVCLGFLILPMFTNLMLIGYRIPALGKIALKGFAAGIIAVAFYDLSRLPFILSGWSDFIPKIGGWVTSTNERNAYIGYTWRYLGNGGGMGMAFFVLLNYLKINRRFILTGLLYGIFIFSSLMTVLVTFEEAQEMMFKITALTFSGSLLGHIIYGLTLGILAKKTLRE